VKYRLVVFDWDGTLIDSAGTIVQCIQDAARDMGIGIPPAERARHVIGLGLHDSLRHAVPGLPTERYREFADHYRRYFLSRHDSMLLFPGVRALLEELKPQRLLAIATGKSRKGLDRALDADGLRAYFAGSRCADETQPKPHPAMLLELMETLQIDKKNTLMVGDTSHDLEMARAAGVDALAVTYGAHDETGLRACSPIGCFPSVEALGAWLKANG
jgi:phosphoglycolate phosphatase